MDQNVQMQDQDLVADLLTSEKLLCSTYNTAVVEAATPNIRNDLKTNLNSQLDIQNTIFNKMNEKGWYPVDSADPNKVQVAKSKFPENPAASQ